MGKKNDVKEGTVVSAAPVGETLADLVKSGAAITRLENDVQMQIAIQHPRDEKKILEESLAELHTYPVAAEAAIYSKPVGKADKCKCGAETFYKPNCPKCNEKVPQKFARGLSIRAAESLGNRWDNSGYALKIASEDEDGAELVAIFLDYERNTRHHIPRRVSKRYKKRNGQMTTHRDDRFKSVVLAAEGSKILREVILRSLPAGLKEEYRIAAEKAVASIKPDNLQRLVNSFATLSVSKEKIETYMSKPIDKFTAEDVLTLRGVFNLIDQGESTIADVFEGKPADDASAVETEPVKGAATVEEVVDGNANVGAEREPAGSKAPETKEPKQKQTEPTASAPGSPTEPVQKKKGAGLL